MRRRTARIKQVLRRGVAGAVAIIVAGIIPGSASAEVPGHQPLAVVCDINGFGQTLDTNALHGALVSLAQYNAHNPLGDTCSVV